MTALFENTVKLRGFLAENVKVPSSDGITEDTFAVLFLATMFGTWDTATNEWTPRITRYRIVCPGPFFCGLTRGMRRGDYVEVEGELSIHDYELPVVVDGEHLKTKRYVNEIRAIQVRRLDRPMELVDTGQDG
jgi:hypothetical protein